MASSHGQSTQKIPSDGFSPHNFPGQDNTAAKDIHRNNMQQWRFDEDLGDNATVSAVLYCNLQHPELKSQFPDYSERSKQIAKIWRKLTTDEKHPYLVRARKNRAQRKKQQHHQQQQQQSHLPVMPEMRSPEMSKSPKAPDEFNYDPLKMYLYKKAIRTGMERESSIRVNIIGNFSQGKTSLTRRLIGTNCEGVISTNGIEIRRFKCRKMKGGRLKLVEDENKDFFGRIAAVARSVDTEKLSERVERTALANTQNNQAVSSIAEDHIFSSLQTQFPATSQEPTQRQILNTPTASEKPTDGRSVSSNVQQQVVNTTQLPSISSEDYQTFSSGVDQEKDDVELSFDMWDFGGQYIFYATHTLFHSRKALYLLVVDLSSPLDKIVIDNEFPAESGEKNMEYFIKFWIESIHAFVGPGPPVILVGTHKDQIEGNEEAKQQYFDQIRSIFEDTDMIDHILPEDFAVDNHDFSDTEIPNLLQYLIQKGSELVQTVEIPARWIQLENKLNQHWHKNVITFQDVMKIDADNEYPLKEEQQVKLFLQYHHEKGTLFYFDEDPMSEHVVLDPGFLVDAFKCIITPERFRLNDISIRPLWCSLKKEAKLSDELINKVWSHNNEDFMKHKMVLLGYLKKHFIISQVVEYDMTRGTYKEQDWYIVPSLLTDNCKMKVMEDFLTEKPRTMVRYFMHFEQTSIVQMLFHRLISAALGKWAVLKFDNKQMLFKDLAVFKLQERLAGIAELRYSGIELRVVSLCKTTIGSQVPDGFRRFIETIVTHEFRKLKSQMGDHAKPFSQKYRCNHKIHDLHGSNQTRDICLLQEKNSVFCPDNYTHKKAIGSEAKAEWFQDESIAVVYPKKNLTQKHLSQLAQAAIGKGWQLLGIELGIKQVEIDHIMEENSQVAMMIFRMLLKWKANSEENATLDVLVESIKKCPSVTVEWDELRNIKDEQSGILMSEHSVFSQPLRDLTVKENDNMFLECAVTKPDLQVIWLKDSEEICTEMRRRKFVKKNIHRLFVENVTNTDAGVYKCVFEDTCTTCTVTVEGRQTPTEFLQKLSDICIEDKSGSASFQCKINKVSVDIKWYHGSQLLSPSEKYQLVDEGPIYILRIHNVVDIDEGTYHIVVDGQTSSAMLSIEDTEEERELIRQYLAEKCKSEDSEGLHEQKRARLDIPSEGPNSTDQNSRTSNQNITNSLLNTDSLWSGIVFRPISTETNQGTKEWLNPVTLELRTYFVEKVVSAIYQSYKEGKVDKLNNIISYAKTVERHAYETANSGVEYYHFMAKKFCEIQTENKQLPGPNTTWKGNQMVDSLVTPIFTQTNQETKQWYKSMTLGLRTHIVQKIVSAFLLPELHATMLRDKRMNNLIAYALKLEGDFYETANYREEYDHFVADKICKIQTELEYKRNERRKLQKHQLPGGTTEASYNKPETSDDEISSQGTAASASRS